MHARRPANACKHYVKVRADFGFDGRVRPLLFREEDGPATRIDRIVDVCPAAARKAGGQGMRYLCQANGRTFALFYDEPYWFIERDADEPDGT